jgi:MFS family permease
MGTVGQRWSACAAAARRPQLRRLALSGLLFGVVESATWTAIVVYAYARGGPREAGVSITAQLLPAVIVAPLASYCGDRFDRIRVLAASHGFVALVCAVLGVALAVEASPIVVYAAAVMLSCSLTVPRPALSSLWPCVVASPADLTAANVASGLATSVAVVVGPALAAAMLSAGSISSVYFVSAAAAALAVALVAGTATVATVVMDEDRVTIGTVRHETMAGLRLLTRQPDARKIAGVLGLSSLMIGVHDVAFVAVALELLRGDQGLAGVFGSAAGVGAMVGAAASVLVVGRRRLAPLLLVAGLLQALPLVGFALPTTIASAGAVFAVSGGAVAYAQIVGETLLQGVTPEDVMARVFGCLEAQRLLAVLAGSALCTALLAWLGTQDGLAVVGAATALVVVVATIRLLPIDRDRRPVDPRLTALLRSVPMFAPLPMYSLEQLALNLRRQPLDEGAVLIRAGDSGHSMYIVGEGSVDVVSNGAAIDRCGVGGYVGEVALLFDQPRNATCVAATPSVVYELERDVFLEAVTGHPRSQARATARATARSTTSPE